MLRLHATRSTSGGSVLLGGQAHRVDPGTPIFAQRGDAAKDVWVRTGADVSLTGTQLRQVQLPQVDFQATLTGRTAETLFWMGRNAENIEAASRYARLLVQWFDTLEEADSRGRALQLALAGLRVLTGRPSESAKTAEDRRTQAPDLWQELRDALVEPGNSVADRIGYLVAGASAGREFLSQTTWRVVSTLQEERSKIVSAVAAEDPLELVESLDRVVVSLAAFSGLAHESIVRGPGWRFLGLGRRLERAVQVAGVLRATLFEPLPAGATRELRELVLAAEESLVAYRRRYRTEPALDTVLRLLADDADNPRSIRYQIDELGTLLFHLPGRERTGLQERLSTVKRAMWNGHEAADLERVVDALAQLAEAIHHQWFVAPEAPRLAGTRREW
ncbi:MAG: alpha-E domain-containing protein [Ilumatobacteraceae bacterium]